MSQSEYQENGPAFEPWLEYQTFGNRTCFGRFGPVFKSPLQKCKYFTSN